MPAFKKILFVDDDIITVNICERMMKVVDFTEAFVSCNDGREAKEYLMSSKGEMPDIVFVDLHMTFMSGWEFLDWFKSWMASENLTTVVYVLSSSLSQDDYDRAAYFHIDGYIIKPMTATHLKDLITKFAVKPSL
jgi:two-component SAPR family response regulator